MTRRISISLGIGGVILGIALLHLGGILEPIENGIRAAFLPVARVFATVGFEIGKHSTSGQTREALEERVRELESRLSANSVDYVKLRALEEENRSLRKLAAFLHDSGYDHVGARVIARASRPQTATLLIDRGTVDGLENGMAVVAEDGIFVGKITTITERLATVTLITDSHSRVAAARSGTRQLIGLVQGEDNGVARLTLVPQALPLSRDTIITTAGTEEKIPPNLPIALVNEVEGKPTDPFKTATLEPLAQSLNLDLVIVLRPAALRPNE